ncbi:MULTISPECIES: glycosyltransferase family 39 protein [unclassified Streptomyces]|uniref:ArnT family glycosyltransferase n=1 Tax=unclassified Streptomyces TaxID=2593676 RepID=UPI001164A582|nr:MULTISPECIES: glycosyltransferase family 39 protein [unclassified Streptomyces]NMI61689.1 phospholipid carrier-dependent glycosyltransferase [Streptomyces sp. RLA2-12]QDN60766.1 phospholipid carrier-dependent glycosyltransferase [Streptomyces sp. S1D4-20]QDN70819.1 phospholipid carrier-dependent glycosyltransferase [Streptomyces sp. S1D4-14]QDO53275.1 phospholipid carrier-dependent glycosyltransferase [Streptomyces sp. RLB3-5]QDO63520.1 phospholipid carrier-dependent glycosyltransferase [St
MTTLAPPPTSSPSSGHRVAPPADGGFVARGRRLFTGPAEDPRWTRPALWAILLAATALYAWNITSISGNSFYNAAVYSGTKSWKAFFFGALDSGSFITVDKPPFALWVMGLSARAFGFGTWQLALPMVAVGTGSVALLHRMVKRDFGPVAATVAASALALTPITVAINRDTNPDPILVFLMLLGAAGLLKAVRTGRLMPLVWSAVAIGFAFNTKMMQAYVVLPAFFLVYLWAAHGSLGRRIRHLAVATVALVVSSAWWMVVVDLIPASSRPYIGGSTDNTVWDLVIGYNGFGRIFGASSSVGSAGNGASFGGSAGVHRLFNEIMGGQISWLIPFATIALIAGLILRGRAPRTDARRAALMLWGGWCVLHYLTFALAEGTFHPYYVTAMAPGIAALAGAGGVTLYRAFREGSAAKWSWVLPAAVAASAAWAIVLLQRVSGSGTRYTVAEIVVGIAGTVAVLGLLAGRFTRREGLIGFAALAAVVALLAGPAAYSVSAATSATNGTNPTAGPSTGGGMGGMGGGPGGASGSSRTSGTGGRSMGAPPSGGGSAPSGTDTRPSGSETEDRGTGSDRTGGGQAGGGQMGGGGTQVSSAMITYLKKHQDGATWLLAVATDQTASSIILESGQPVISMGGWSGSDNAMTLAKLKSLVKSGKLHYIIVSSDGGQGTNSEIATWVKAHGTAVKSSAYSSGSSSTTPSSTSSTSSTGGLYRLDASDVG